MHLYFLLRNRSKLLIFDKISLPVVGSSSWYKLKFLSFSHRWKLGALKKSLHRFPYQCANIFQTQCSNVFFQNKTQIWRAKLYFQLLYTIMSLNAKRMCVYDAEWCLFFYPCWQQLFPSFFPVHHKRFTWRIEQRDEDMNRLRSKQESYCYIFLASSIEYVVHASVHFFETSPKFFVLNSVEKVLTAFNEI